MEATHHMIRLLLLSIWLSVWASPSLAADIAVVSHKPLNSITQLASAISDQTGLSVEVRLVHEKTDWQQYRVVVLAGAQALQQWQERDVPAVAVFVSRQHVRQSSLTLASALYIEPPLERQIALAKAILGPDRPLGILAANPQQLETRRYAGKPLTSALITPYFVDQSPSLNRALIELLRDNSALIGVYDPGLFSSANIKNILITAYRQNKPLIGPSSAYIKAGALATTYSDLDDVVQRLREILLTGLNENIWPEAGYNPYFKVRYNQQVGRSLNLLLPDQDALQQQLQQLEAR